VRPAIATPASDPGPRCDGPIAGAFAGLAPDADDPIRLDAVGEALLRCGLTWVRRELGTLVERQTVAAIAPPAENPEHAALYEGLERFCEREGLESRLSGQHDAYEVVLPGRDRAAPVGLLFVVHADVVPVNDPPSLVPAGAVPDGWTVPPFEVTERDGRLYGRGTEDDKGPMAVAMVVLAALRAAGIVPPRDVVLAAGTAEEEDWDGMHRYAEATRAQSVVSLDASFPVVVAESGFVAWGLRVPVAGYRPGRLRIPAAAEEITHLESGLFLTQIPDRAVLRLRALDGDGPALAERVRSALAQASEERGPDWGITGTVALGEDGEVELALRGVSAHSSLPEQGRNALSGLAAVASRLALRPNAESAMLAVVGRYFDGDLYGERAGLAHEDPLMGRLVASPTKLRVADGFVTLEINMRRPRGRSAVEVRSDLARLVRDVRRDYGARFEAIPDVWVGEPHVVDPDSELVRELLAAYREVSGDAAAEAISERGSTYARLFPGAVSFGPSVPGQPFRGHGADEYIEIDALALMLRAVLSATTRLAL